jgi:hypothetical protein
MNPYLAHDSQIVVWCKMVAVIAPRCVHTIRFRMQSSVVVAVDTQIQDRPRSLCALVSFTVSVIGASLTTWPLIASSR